ncbi:MAG TPA: sigma 54-interacting transcriptional regulator [bacterium]|nr:sigma 54-interacting transcriptional regulator [bacterium]
MSGASEAPDKLQVLRERLEYAVTPAERVRARLALAEELALTDPAAARPLLEQVVEEAEEAGGAESRLSAAAVLSDLLRWAGDYDGSMRYADMMLRAGVATDDRQNRATGLNLVGLIHQERGELEQALGCFEESLRLSRETGFGLGEQKALNQLAGVNCQQGDLEKALAYLRQALEASIKAGDTYGRAVNQRNVGWVLVLMGRWAEATEHYHRTVALCEEHGFHPLLLATQMSLGELSSRRTDYEAAEQMLRAVIKAGRESKHSGYVYREAVSNLGWVHFRRGELARAEETLNEAVQLGEAAEDRYLLASTGLRRAELALAQGRIEAARELLAQAGRIASELNLRKEQGEALRVEALLSAARSDSNSALELLARSEAALGPFGDTYELAQTRLQHGRLLVELHRSEEALPLLQAAARTFRRLAVPAEAEEASRLLYRLEVEADRPTALVQGLMSIMSLDLAVDRLVDLALAMICDNLRFEQGAVLVNGRAVASKGNPDLTELPRRRASLFQSDLDLLLPVRQGRRLLGHVWLRRKRPLASRVEPRNLNLVSRTLAPLLAKLGRLTTIEAGRTRRIPGLRFRGVVGRNPEVLKVLELIPRIATTDVAVLVCGESGSGKELVARALHESGPRADHPFITVNCAAIPESLLEAEFFGVEEGAATGVAARPGKFELARNGTIFLDEIGDMSPALQARLLRVLEDHKITRVGGTKEMAVDVWVIAATNMDLAVRAREGKFRTDLFFRLNPIPLVLPPLRRRREDIPLLTKYFVARTAQEYKRPVRRVSEEVMALFARYDWPGNIRQLKHAIQRGVVLAAGDEVEVSDLPPEFRPARPAAPVRRATSLRRAKRRTADKAERAMLLKALARAKGNATEAMKLAGYSRTHFYRLLRKHKIP